MSKKCRKSKKSILLGFIFMLCLALGPFSSFGKADICKASEYTPGENSAYDEYPYTLDAYLVEIQVNEDNTLNITEKIKANFKQPRHGIYRKIPLKNEVIRADGSKSTVRAKVSNVMVADVPFEEYKESGYWFIKVGDPAYVLTGTKTYTIQYTYTLGKDPLKDKDEFYFNIIGPEWDDTAIGNVAFKITMPKDFDPSLLGFSSGVEGMVGSDKVVYEVDGRTIIGAYEGILEPKEALTVRCELPEGYFTGSSLTGNFPTWIYVVFFLPVGFVAIAGILWFKYGRDDQVVETVEFYPPEGLNSMEIGFLYKGYVEDLDILSLLIELANKGYIALEEIEETGLFKKKKTFRINKIREYDGTNINERLFFHGLFATKVSISLKDMLKGQQPQYEENVDSVTAVDLQYRFYRTINQIKSNVNSSENKDMIFEQGLNGRRALIITMIALTFIGITIPPMMNLEQAIFLSIFAIVFPGIGFTVLISMVFGKSRTVYVNGKPKKSSWGSRLFGLVWGGIFGGAPWAFLVLPNLLDEPFYFFGYMLGILCIAGMLLFNRLMPKRTPYGNQMLGRIRGFKTYLETAEKWKLESMVAENPQYFYDILPYTYVLGVSDKWISKFESILMQEPNWYHSPTGDAFSAAAFGDFMNQTMSTAQSTMASSPSSDGGGGGGGSSGGGSGGGGGGSW